LNADYGAKIKSAECFGVNLHLWLGGVIMPSPDFLFPETLMPHEGSLLQAVVVLSLAAVLLVPLAKRMQLGAVLGYLIAGVLIGPATLQLIHKPENIGYFTESGVVLLLFIIGLELSPRRLWVMHRAVFGVGAAQVALSALLIGATAYYGFAQSINISVILGLGLGLGLALSSTAFGLQILAERKALTSRHGCLGFAILSFQDAERAQAGISRFQQHDEDLLADQHKVFGDRDALMQSAREFHDELQALFDVNVIEERRL
jgi:hypothetical protein